MLSGVVGAVEHGGTRGLMQWLGVASAQGHWVGFSHAPPPLCSGVCVETSWPPHRSHNSSDGGAIQTLSLQAR